MPLQLLPLEESDIDAQSEINWQAFKPGIMGVLFPSGYKPEDRAWMKESTLRDWHQHPEFNRAFKVIDTDLPRNDPLKQIVGTAKWKIYPAARTQFELDAADKEAKAGGRPPNAGPALKAFREACGRNKREILGGKPYMLLHVLATHPQHQRRGVGGLHLQWGKDEADRLGLPMYLESSPEGKAVYERHGFEFVKWLEWDAREFGHQDACRHAIMMRPAKRV
ncbi:acyl-CoA N-acyltransferase [Teratosphaeria nubilosa]|uniref:Acyl-CoA N-acyltransferase n=1 Tax=Teratosphaeria nubilosa TaxID=161662 RepID=A0A6G1KX66_9PEZI|nr:acyl-CoA N-acyltransferase [Teratosphaeria nubilosa]